MEILLISLGGCENKVICIHIKMLWKVPGVTQNARILPKLMNKGARSETYLEGDLGLSIFRDKVGRWVNPQPGLTVSHGLGRSVWAA